MAGGDAQAVATLLRLGGIGVEDAQPEGRRIEDQKAVSARPPMAITDLRQQRNHSLQRSWEIQDQIVVAEGLVLEQFEASRSWACHTLESSRMEYLFRWPAQRLTHCPTCFCS